MPESNVARPASRPAREIFVAVVCGAFLFLAIDVAVGTAFGLGAVRGGTRTVLLGTLLGAHAGVLALGAGVALAAAHAATRGRRAPLGRLAPTWTLVAAGVGAAAVVTAMNWELFRGGWVGSKAWRPAAEWAFRIVAAPATALGIWWLAARVRAGAPRRAGWGAACVVAAATCLVVNAKVYRTNPQYQGIHVQLSIAAFALCGAAAYALFFGRRPIDRVGRLAPIVAAVAAAAPWFGLFAAREVKVFRAVKGVALERAYGVAKLATWSSPLVDVAADKPRTPASVDASALLSVKPLKSAEEVQQELDHIYPDRKKLNVLFLAVDTLRADRCGFLGYSKDGVSPTPHLDALAKEAFVFRHAYTAYPTSNYAFSSVFTSLSARINYVYGKKWNDKFAFEPQHSLPTLLGEHGWRTAAVTAFERDDLDDIKFFKGLKVGFEEFNPDPWEKSATGAQIVASTSKLLTTMSAQGRLPFFFWAHLIDPHKPYEAHDAFRFGDSPEERYLSDIAYADHHVGLLIDRFKELGLWDDTIVVFCSDHGEEFNERGSFEHNSSVYEEQIRVPLMVRLPGVQGRTVESTVSLLDIQPTLTQLLKVPDPIRRMGSSLLPLMFGPEHPEMGFAYSEQFTFSGNLRNAERRAFIIGRRKIIHRVHEKAYEIYDLAADPGEKETLVGVAPDEEILKALLAQWDRKVDDYFGEVARAPAPVAMFDELFAKLERQNADAIALKKSDPKASREAASAARATAAEIHRTLLTGYGDIKVNVANALTPEQIASVFERLYRLYPTLEDGPAAEALITLSRRPDPRFADLYRREVEPLFKGEYTRLRSGAMEAMIALTSFGDESVREPLRVAYAADVFPNKSQLAVGLARLGDATGAEWFLLNLSCLRFGWVYRDSLLTMPKVMPAIPVGDDVPSASRLLRDRMAEEDFRHPELNLALVRAMQAIGDEDARVTLCRLARNFDPDVRKAAVDALRTLYPDAADLEARLEAAGDELDADNSQLNGSYEVATATYKRALARAGFFHAGLRFRLARAYHRSGAVDRARETLEEIAAKAPLAYDRRLAARRLDQLKYDPSPGPDAFRCEVTKVEEPGVVRANQYFALRITLKNAGAQPWWGGWAVGTPELQVRFVDAAGVVQESPQEKLFVNRLPEEGVNPGEEVSLLLLGYGQQPSFEGRLSLSFKNPRCQYPNDGLVWKGSKVYDFSERPKPASRPASPR
ncbi:MAG TPA: sulfatase-like hydrolase/transferase [Planctomycetota bacterium]|nr:sulfatase-like hydrolase/transferase [Planctomycetota bacterium]